MKILGIDTSCDETAAAVVADGREVLSNVVASQVETHQEYGGVVPELASRKHIEAINYIVSRALAEADVTFKDLEAIAVTNRPRINRCVARRGRGGEKSCLLPQSSVARYQPY